MRIFETTRWVVLGLIFSVGAAAAQTDGADPIEAFGERWQAAYQAGDMEALRDLYEPDVWLMTRHQPAKIGRDAVLDYFAAIKARGATASIEFEYEDRVIDGDYAFVISKWWLTVAPAEGEPFHDAGRSFLVFKKGGDDKWRVWRDIDNHTPDVEIRADKEAE